MNKNEFFTQQHRIDFADGSFCLTTNPNDINKYFSPPRHRVDLGGGSFALVNSQEDFDKCVRLGWLV